MTELILKASEGMGITSMSNCSQPADLDQFSKRSKEDTETGKPYGKPPYPTIYQ